MCEIFLSWLLEKLRELKTDETVFSSYIVGILEGDESDDEKFEALEEILKEMIENNLNGIVHEIIDKWKQCHTKSDESKPAPAGEDVDAQLARILEAQTIQTVHQRQYTAEELRIREQILSQYSQLSVSEDSDEGSGVEADPGLVKNTNAHDVQQALKERREQAKLESQKKKEKDKEDREKQKQLREEKKEKRKTVKGERRR